MNDLTRAVRVAVSIVASFCSVVSIASGECSSERQATLKADFNIRLKPYLHLREEAKSRLPPLRETRDPSGLKDRQQALSNHIRVTRPNARQGDILGDPIAGCLIWLTQRSLTANTAKQTTKEGNPAHEGGKVTVAVNAPYPSEAPLSTMPPGLLAELPTLPEGLEFRFIGDSLILYDADGCLIIDFLPHAGV